MSILITGGSGLIGASLTRLIVELGERPAIFDVAPSPPILKKIDSKFKYFQGSLDHLQGKGPVRMGMEDLLFPTGNGR